MFSGLETFCHSVSGRNVEPNMCNSSVTADCANIVGSIIGYSFPEWDDNMLFVVWNQGKTTRTTSNKPLHE